jgi:hypothetical protein
MFSLTSIVQGWLLGLLHGSSNTHFRNDNYSAYAGDNNIIDRNNIDAIGVNNMHCFTLGTMWWNRIYWMHSLCLWNNVHGAESMVLSMLVKEPRIQRYVCGSVHGG